MRFVRTLLFLFITMVVCVTANDRSVIPKEACGRGELVRDKDGEFWMRSDDLCHQVAGKYKSARVYKGCQCKFFNSYACGGGDRVTGLVITEGSKYDDRIITFADWSNVNWYICALL
ncbi:hypothetical protein GQ44DRAFT_824985 [Phaeosphaeriaceae sp. PMI808]|nr:hypothetical protein GQ44DRAFT_824985 [Phaeosphaeriaceae sp. PMI808]